MYIDIRVRDLTDFFVKTEDYALSEEGMAFKATQGSEFRWKIYAMTRKGAAILHTQPYAETNHALDGYGIKAKSLWGLVDTLKRQDRKKYKVSVGNRNVTAEMEFTEDKKVVEEKNEWGWLYEAMKELHDDGYDELEADALWNYLDIRGRKLSPYTVGRQLNKMGIQTKSNNGIYYLDGFNLDKPREKKILAMVRV
jgi:hypothetical protein